MGVRDFREDGVGDGGGERMLGVGERGGDGLTGVGE